MQTNTNNNLAFAGRVTFSKRALAKAYNKSGEGLTKLDNEIKDLVDFARTKKVDLHVGGIKEKGNADRTPYIPNVILRKEPGNVVSKLLNPVTKWVKNFFPTYETKVHRQDTFLGKAKFLKGLMDNEQAAKLANKQKKQKNTNVLKEIKQKVKSAKNPKSEKPVESSEQQQIAHEARVQIEYKPKKVN